eukprot:COSAG04_NODE_230_length_19216_cov_15.830787_6_plen_51_part_00
MRACVVFRGVSVPPHLFEVGAERGRVGEEAGAERLVVLVGRLRRDADGHR